MIIFWRGWGLIIIATAGLPMMFSMPAILSRMQAAPDQAITGHFAPPMLLSAILTFVAHKLLSRGRGERQDEFMFITVKKWTFVFLAAAVVLTVLGALGY